MVFCRVPPSVVLKTKQTLCLSIHPENALLLVHHVISVPEARCVVALMYRKGAGVGSIVLDNSSLRSSHGGHSNTYRRI